MNERVSDVSLIDFVLKLVVSRGEEAAILKWLHTRPHDHPGASRYTIKGSHQVFVMDVLGSFYLIQQRNEIMWGVVWLGGIPSFVHNFAKVSCGELTNRE